MCYNEYRISICIRMKANHTFYKNETYKWSSSPKDGKVHGTHNIVTIKDGKGTKVKETLNAKGKTMRRKTVKLSTNEIKNITEGRFMPGFWTNCVLGNTRKCTRRNNRA